MGLEFFENEQKMPDLKERFYAIPCPYTISPTICLGQWNGKKLRSYYNWQLPIVNSAIIRLMIRIRPKHRNGEISTRSRLVIAKVLYSHKNKLCRFCFLHSICLVLSQGSLGLMGNFWLITFPVWLKLSS